MWKWKVFSRVPYDRTANTDTHQTRIGHFDCDGFVSRNPTVENAVAWNIPSAHTVPFAQEVVNVHYFLTCWCVYHVPFDGISAILPPQMLAVGLCNTFRARDGVWHRNIYCILTHGVCKSSWCLGHRVIEFLSTVPDILEKMWSSIGNNGKTIPTKLPQWRQQFLNSFHWVQSSTDDYQFNLCVYYYSVLNKEFLI